MAIAHISGFPRIGADRELKRALEAYWQGQLSEAELQQVGRELRAQHWQWQQEAGLDWVTVGDFAWYDHVLSHSLLVGAVPPRFLQEGQSATLETLFAMARGVNGEGVSAPACVLTKWFDTNYHYLVPEFEAEQSFQLGWTQLFDEVAEAQALGYQVKPVLLGPLSFLWLGRMLTPGADRLDLLDALLPVYLRILQRLAEQGVEWVQLDEPILALDLPTPWKAAFERAYHHLQRAPSLLLLASSLGGLGDNLVLACGLPVAGLQVDLVANPGQLPAVMDRLPDYRVLSLGVVNGRNIWRCDLAQAQGLLEQAKARWGERLWVSTSCSLLHTPVDVRREPALPPELQPRLAFAVQKCAEVALLARLLEHPEEIHLQGQVAQAQGALAEGTPSNPQVQARLATLTPEDVQRHPAVAERRILQRQRLQLPAWPTTTIGSFPQTPNIRQNRQAWRQGRLSDADYRLAMEEEITQVIATQERLGLDVLVHGEPERNDMVEYFAEQLEGYALTRFGWVQSYGSRCVKPAIIYADISRPQPMTLPWIRHAQQQTSKPVKGMLTGPVTLLQWSFPREDIPLATQARQLALAIRDEVQDLEAAGTAIIQIDEAAFREGLPLRQGQWAAYLGWAVEAFRLCSSGVRPDTQIHTHMCYSQFQDVMAAIAALDADVISIETSRAQMTLLDTFRDFAYPGDIGPGVYDIHSPRVPSVAEMVDLLERALKHLPASQLWVNPDCGLKTRNWPEVEAALANMVAAAQQLRRRGYSEGEVAAAQAEALVP